MYKIIGYVQQTTAHALETDIQKGMGVLFAQPQSGTDIPVYIATDEPVEGVLPTTTYNSEYDRQRDIAAEGQRAALRPFKVLKPAGNPQKDQR